MARYRTSDFRAARTMTVETGWNQYTTITTEVGELHDTRTGDRFPTGALRVRLTGHVRATRTFTGETRHQAATSWLAGHGCGWQLP